MISTLEVYPWVGCYFVNSRTWAFFYKDKNSGTAISLIKYFTIIQSRGSQWKDGNDHPPSPKYN